MLIRNAKPSDKSKILKFCKNTFSWGDYIKDVWDFWLKEKNLLVIEKDSQIGICHAVFFKKQGWIEGIRINPIFRRQGLASKLISSVEFKAKKKKIPTLFMLIETGNFASLKMAKRLDYKIFQTWKFYSLLPKKNFSQNISFKNKIKTKQFPHFINSWRWIPLDNQTISNLVSNNQVVSSSIRGTESLAIFEDSEHFKKTLIVTLFSGSKTNTLNLLSFLQNYGFEKKYKRIQILTKEVLPEFKDLEKRISFHLMKKSLS